MHSEFGLLSTVAYKLGENSSPVYALEGSVQEAGSIISWLTSIGISCVEEKIASAKHPNYDNDINYFTVWEFEDWILHYSC